MTKLLGGLDSSASVRRLHKNSTHPSLLVRARALLHWDMVSRFDQEEISTVNRRISNDMYKFIDKTSRTKLADLQLDVCIWKLMTLMFGEHYSLDAMKKVVASQFDGQVVESVSELLQEELNTQDLRVSVVSNCPSKTSKRSFQNCLDSP